MSHICVLNVVDAFWNLPTLVVEETILDSDLIFDWLHEHHVNCSMVQFEMNFHTGMIESITFTTDHNVHQIGVRYAC